MGRLRAFTVLEIVIALAVVSILLMLAVPSYQHYMQRAKRAEAVRALLAAANCQERIRAARGYYDTSSCLDDWDAAAYAPRIAPPGESATLEFTLLAEPTRPRSGDRCGTLSLDQAGTRSVSGDAADLAACWGGR